VTTEQGGSQTSLSVIDGGAEEQATRPNGQRVQQLIGNTIVPYGYEAWDDGLFYQTAPPEDNSIEPSIERTVPRESLIRLRPPTKRFPPDPVSGKE